MIAKSLNHIRLPYLATLEAVGHKLGRQFRQMKMEVVSTLVLYCMTQGWLMMLAKYWVQEKLNKSLKFQISQYLCPRSLSDNKSTGHKLQTWLPGKIRLVCLSFVLGRCMLQTDLLLQWPCRERVVQWLGLQARKQETWGAVPTSATGLVCAIGEVASLPLCFSILEIQTPPAVNWGLWMKSAT